MALSELQPQFSNEKFFEQKIKQEWSEVRPSFSDFEDLVGMVYTAEELREDKLKTKGKSVDIGVEGEFGRWADYELAEDIEYSLMEAIQNFEWFGEEVSVSPASRFDDLFRGTDFVLTFRKNEDEYDYLAVDATVAKEENVILDKDKRVYDELDEGRLTEVKYFINDDNPEIRGKFNMPHLILALSPSLASEFRNILSKGRNLSFDDKNRLDDIQKEITRNITERLEGYIKHLRLAIETKKGLADKRSIGIRKRQQEILGKYQEVLAKFKK